MEQGLLLQTSVLPFVVLFYACLFISILCQLAEAAAFDRSDDPLLFPPEKYQQKVEDTCSGPNAPDLELFSAPFGLWKRDAAGKDEMFPTGDYGSVVAVLLRCDFVICS